MSGNVDVVIVGAGPAGANLARLIGSRYKVLILDKRSFGSDAGTSPGKCCGGLLAPDAQKMLARLRLELPRDILAGPQLFAVRTLDFTNDLERTYQRFYVNIDRARFDQWMVSLIPPETERVLGAAFKSFSPNPEGCEVRYLQQGRERIVQTKLLVGADGALSRVRQALAGTAPEPGRYIALQEWYESSTPLSHYIAVFDEAVSDFYSWVIPKDGRLLLGAALRVGDDLQARLNLLKTKLTAAGLDLGRRIRAESAFIYRPGRPSHFLPGQGSVALIGEASGAISPSSAEGISYALLTSACLARSLGEGPDGCLRRYSQETRSIRSNLALKLMKQPVMYNRLLRRAALQSGLLSIRDLPVNGQASYNYGSTV